jgi:uncharacterized repeat protein (TIGR01451 family)
VDDEDDHDIAPITVGAFDLALRKQLIPGQHPTFQANDSVRFLIEVFNQGNITATNITIVDYIPAGFVLSSTAPVNAGWVVNGNVAQTTLPGPLAPGASITREIVLFVVEAAGVVTNYAEITGASDEDGTPTPDIDSTPDAINGNDPYVDDVIDDDGTIDEDDHDGAEITVDRFDMSLIKRLADGQEVQVQTGDDVEYTIQVRNEGSALALRGAPDRLHPDRLHPQPGGSIRLGGERGWPHGDQLHPWPDPAGWHGVDQHPAARDGAGTGDVHQLG